MPLLQPRRVTLARAQGRVPTACLPRVSASRALGMLCLRCPDPSALWSLCLLSSILLHLPFTFNLCFSLIRRSLRH